MSDSVSGGNKSDVDLSSVFPDVEQFSSGREDYIRSLEMAVKLLQREIENLRLRALPTQDAHPAGGGPESKAVPLLRAASEEADILSCLIAGAEEYFPVEEGALYLPDERGRPTIALLPSPSPYLATAYARLDEEGICDWALRHRKSVAIANLEDSTVGRETSILLVPLALRSTVTGLAVLLTPRAPATIPPVVLASIDATAEAAALALDNVRSRKEIAKMNERLRSQNEQVVQSAKLASIGRLAGSVAHEINNPLQILLGHLQLLQSGSGDIERRISVIKQQVFRISDITRRLLDFSRSSPASTPPAEVDLEELVDDVLAFVGAQLRRDGIAINRPQGDATPPAALGVKSQLEQVLLNIILNARDAMPDGGTLTIASFETDNSQCALSISDTGKGIPKDIAAHIFEPFFTTKDSGKGTGLGLSISAEIVRGMNGKIRHVPSPGGGATFIITLPLFRPGGSAR